MEFKSYDFAKMVIEVANEKFSPIWSLDEQRVNAFKTYCDAIDKVIADTPDGDLSFYVDEIKMTMNVSFQVERLFLEKADAPFCQLVDRSLEFGFAPDGEKVMVSLTFPSLWIQTI